MILNWLELVGEGSSKPDQPDALQFESADLLTSFFDSIVAVNGLNGHPRRSWTSEGSEQTQCMWLEELLPPNMPNARIMLFGYNCHSNGEDSLLSAAGLTHAAETLVTALDSNRAGATVSLRITTWSWLKLTPSGSIAIALSLS